MSTFTYDFATDPLIANVRLLISDTAEPFIFSDEEIQAFYNIVASQYQSSMFFSGPAYRTLPQQPVSYVRVAALALDSLASNAARLASVTKLLDVSLAPDKAAISLRDQAKAYREMDDDAGAFAIVEQVTTGWSFVDRFWSQVQRQSGGGAF